MVRERLDLPQMPAIKVYSRLPLLSASITITLLTVRNMLSVSKFRAQS